MELWIRSQDKELLVLAKGFEFQHVSYDGSYQIFAVWQNNYQMVGKYKNKKRALEVLDEIQNEICNLEVIKTYAIKLDLKENEETADAMFRRFVYQMPEE